MGHGIGRRAFMKMGGQAMYRISDFHVPLHSKRGPGDTFTSTGNETFRISLYMISLIFRKRKILGLNRSAHHLCKILD